MKNQSRPQSTGLSSPNAKGSFRIKIIAAILLFSILSFFFFNFGPRSGDHPSGYSYYRGITIDHTKVAGSSDLENFPVLISIKDNDYRSVSNGGSVESTNGYDIIFTDDNGDQLPFEIEDYDAKKGEIVAWVRVSELSASQNTILRMYYGNSSVSSAQSTSNTWSSDFKAVYHFNDSYDDASSNGFDAVESGTKSKGGLYADGKEFKGKKGYLSISKNAIPSSGGFSYSMWIKPKNVKDANLIDVYSSTGGEKYYTLGFDKDEVVWKFEDEDDTDVEIESSTKLSKN